MELVVTKIGKAIPSKFDNRYMNTQIQLMSTNANDNKSYKLNVSTKYMKELGEWSNACIKGNVLKVEMQENGVNVNPFKPFEIVKDVRDNQTKLGV